MHYLGQNLHWLPVLLLYWHLNYYIIMAVLAHFSLNLS